MSAAPSSQEVTIVRVTQISKWTAAGLACLALGGCAQSGGSGDAGQPTTGASAAQGADEQAVARITVTPAAEGEAPTVSLPSIPFTVSEQVTRIVTEGDGPQIGEEDSVKANYLLINGRDGKPRASMWGEDQATLEIARIPQFKELVGTAVGSTVLVVIPAGEAFGGQGDQALDIKPEDTLIYVLQTTEASAPLTEATGTPVPPKEGLPTVKMPSSPSEPAAITVPEGAPPSTTVAQPLIVGEGPKVQTGQTVRVTYTGVTWRDPKTPFDYSGKSPQGYAEFQVGTGNLIKAWDEHLVGQPVGSRLLLVVPPADGYGAEGQPPQITGEDTLVFVIDILAAR